MYVYTTKTYNYNAHLVIYNEIVFDIMPELWTLSKLLDCYTNITHKWIANPTKDNGVKQW